MAWRQRPNAGFDKELRSQIGRDGSMMRRIEKKMAKIVEDPERVGDWKSGPLKGLKSEPVGHYVILFRYFPDEENPPGEV
jgi:hypothetical protein